MSDTTQEELMQEIRDLIETFAAAKSDRVRLEHFRTAKRAILMQQAEREGYSSVTAQQREAEASPEYIEVIDGLARATYLEEKARWELQISQNKFEAWRTRMANAREEMKRYGVRG